MRPHAVYLALQLFNTDTAGDAMLRVNLTVTGSDGYDLIVEPPRKKSNALPIMTGH